MIKCDLIDLPPQEQDLLREWLRHPARSALERVVAAKAKKPLCELTADALQAGTYPAKMDAANARLNEAQRYYIFLEVLKEIASQKELFYTVKMT